MAFMRQLITRLDDDLHTRLKAMAQAEGRSVNALVVEALEQVAGLPIDARAALRLRAREAGLLVVPPEPGQAMPRDRVIASTRGSGTSVGEALAAERDAS